MKFAQNVARIKREVGCTDAELASATGLSSKTVKRILGHTRSRKAEYIPSLGTVEKLARALKVSLDDLVKHDVSLLAQ